MGRPFELILMANCPGTCSGVENEVIGENLSQVYEYMWVHNVDFYEVLMMNPDYMVVSAVPMFRDDGSVPSQYHILYMEWVDEDLYSFNK